MKIKYISCDNQTFVEEEIIKAEFIETDHPHYDIIQIVECERTPSNPYYKHNARRLDNIFTVDFKRVKYIKEG